MLTVSEIRIGDRVRFRRRGSTVWRYGTVQRWSYSREGKMLAQVRVDRVDGQPLEPPTTARLRPERLEIVEQDA